MKVLYVFDSSLDQIDVGTGVSWNSDDVFNISNGSCFCEAAEKDREESEQHFGLSLVLCRCGRKGTGCCGEMGLGFFVQ